MQIPNSKVLCSVLSKAEQSKTRLNIKADFLPILQSVLPDIYGNPTFPAHDTIQTQFPPDKDIVILLSGGLGSCASLWRLLSSGRDPSIVFIEGLFQKPIELKRRECIKNIMLEGRSSTGTPLMDMDTHTTWLSTLKAPKEAKLLSRKSKIALIISLIWEAYDGNGLPSLIWGNVHDSLDVLQSMKSWGFTHVVPFDNDNSFVFCLSEAENISDTLREKYNVYNLILSPSQIMPKQITNLVCSCQEFKERNNQIGPFASMCLKCSGCSRYFDSWKDIVIDVHCIHVGSLKDDHRYYTNMPTFREEAKNRIDFSAFIHDKKESKEKKSKRGKKKAEEEKVAEEDEDVSESEDESPILEEPDFQNIPIVEEDAAADEDAETYDFEDAFEVDEDESEPKKRKRKIL
jgi:hypothetical protein